MTDNKIKYIDKRKDMTMKKEINKQIEKQITKITVLTDILEQLSLEDTDVILKSLKSELENFYKTGEELFTPKEKSEIEFILAYYKHEPCDCLVNIVSRTKTIIDKLELRQLGFKKLIYKTLETSEQAFKVKYPDEEETKYNCLKDLRNQLDVLYGFLYGIFKKQELKTLNNLINDIENSCFKGLYQEDFGSYYSLIVSHVQDFISDLLEQMKPTKEMTKFKKARLDSGLSQSELSTLSEVPIRVIQSVEQGYRDIQKTNVTYIIMLCNTLKCKLQDILEDEEVVEMLNEIYK